MASELGQAEVVKQLLSGGANANVQFMVRKYNYFHGQVLITSGSYTVLGNVSRWRGTTSIS